MITLSNIRIENSGKWTKLVCDIDGISNYIPKVKEKNMWIAVKKENQNMLCSDTYDAFLLVPYFLAMKFGCDLKIEGNVSSILRRNLVNYLSQIFYDFEDNMKKIHLIVDGVKDDKHHGSIIGTGLTCGVDSLAAVYDNFILEKDDNYKINALFFFNCGTHGDYEVKETYTRFLDRYKIMEKAADDLGLPLYAVDSNIHAFTHSIGTDEKIGYLSMYSCVLALQRSVIHYYCASDGEYSQLLEFAKLNRNYCIAEYAETYLVPLVRTESLEFELSGAQHGRLRKTELISDWDFAKKHLNVCVYPLQGGGNCSKCNKCMRTQIPLDAMGKLEEFSEVFDLNVYHKHKFVHQSEMVTRASKNQFARANVVYAKGKGMRFPNLFIAHIRTFPRHIRLFVANWIWKHYGKEKFREIRDKLRRSGILR